MPNLKNYVMTTKPRVLLYGASGTGKTHFLSTTPKPYVFDFDNGIETLAGQDIEYDFYDPMKPQTTWEAFKRKLSEFERGKVQGVETVAIDSLSALCDCAAGEVLRINGRTALAKTQQDWGQEITLIEEILYRLNTVSTHYNVIVTAHEQVKDDEVSGETFVVPIVSGKKMPFQIPRFFTEVYRLYTERTKEKVPSYRLLTTADRRYSAKSRLGGLEPVEVPDFQALLVKSTRGKGHAGGGTPLVRAE